MPLEAFLKALPDQGSVAIAQQGTQTTGRADKVVICWLAQPMCGAPLVQLGFMASFIDFVDYDRVHRNVYAGYKATMDAYIPGGRDKLCRQFLKEDASWLLMLDWDVTYEPKDVYTLLDAAHPVERPIIAGMYPTFFGEDNLLRPCWMHEDKNQEYRPPKRFRSGVIVECSSVGMGFTLIHRSVLDAMTIKYKHDPWKFFGNDPVNGARVGEDITFCSRARSLGFKVWGHGGVLIGHTKAKTWTAQDMQVAMEMEGA